MVILLSVIRFLLCKRSNRVTGFCVDVLLQILQLLVQASMYAN